MNEYMNIKRYGKGYMGGLGGAGCPVYCLLEIVTTF